MSSIILILAAAAMIVAAGYMCTTLKFAEGQVQFFPEDTNINRFTVNMAEFKSNPESCDFRCVDSVRKSTAGRARRILPATSCNGC